MAYDIQSFDEDVLAKSREVPVLVDFWAPWCGPCRILGPVLEKLAGEAEGRWVLAKVNTEMHPDVGARYGVRGIPDVRLFVNEEPVDGFMGALPEPALRTWLDERLPSPEDEEVQTELRRIEAMEGPSEVLLHLETLWARYPERPDLRFALAKRVLFTDPERAALLVDRMEPRGVDLAAIEGVRTVAQSLVSVASEGVQEVLSEARSSLEDGDMDHGLATLIKGIRTGQGTVRDELRGLVVALFHLLGHDHPLTTKYRQALTQALYV